MKRFILVFVLLTWPICAQAQVTRVILQWNPNSEPDLAGYIVGTGTASRVYDTTLDVGNTTTAPAITLSDPTKNYYFAVLAYNTAGKRSEFSAEAVWQPPAGPAPPECVFTLSGPTTVGAGGGTGELSVIPSDPSCQATLSSTATWLTLQPASGTGAWTTRFTAAINNTQSTRTAGVVLNGIPQLQLSQEPMPVDPCTIAIPAITVTGFTDHFKAGGYGTVTLDLRLTIPNQLGSTIDLPRSFSKVRVWMDGVTSPPAQAVVISTSGDTLVGVKLRYYANVKGVFPWHAEAYDSLNCRGETGQPRQVRVN